ncbi:tail fiber protein [Verrucomicrobiaceae bacterium 227]
MSEPFLSELRMFGFNFPPRGWSSCDGQLLPINQNQALFSLLGTTYGGDGRTTFALPELRGRSPRGMGISDQGQSAPLGQKSGAETDTINVTTMPSHSHGFNVDPNGSTETTPGGHFLGVDTDPVMYHPVDSPVTLMDEEDLTSSGGGLPHDNMQPFLAINFCIAMVGLFPSRN